MNLILFWYVAMHYRYKDVKHAQKRYVGGASLKPPRGPVPPWARAREVGIPIGHRRPVSASPAPIPLVQCRAVAHGLSIGGRWCNGKRPQAMIPQVACDVPHLVRALLLPPLHCGLLCR